MSKGISIEKIYRFLKKYYRLIIGFIFALLVVFWGLIYYQYIHIPTNSQVDLIDSKITINEEVMQQVLTDLKDREDNLSRTLKNTYPDLFTP